MLCSGSVGPFRRGWTDGDRQAVVGEGERSPRKKRGGAGSEHPFDAWSRIVAQVSADPDDCATIHSTSGRGGGLMPALTIQRARRHDRRRSRPGRRPPDLVRRHRQPRSQTRFRLLRHQRRSSRRTSVRSAGSADRARRRRLARSRSLAARQRHRARRRHDGGAAGARAIDSQTLPLHAHRHHRLRRQDDDEGDDRDARRHRAAHVQVVGQLQQSHRLPALHRQHAG